MHASSVRGVPCAGIRATIVGMELEPIIVSSSVVTVTIPDLRWPPGSWASTDEAAYSDALGEGVFRALATEIVTANVGRHWRLPWGPGLARARHVARIGAIRRWLSDMSAENVRQPDVWRAVVVRAIGAWTSSRPGDIRNQHQYLPDLVRNVLNAICEVLGGRGGESTYAPISAAIADCDDWISLSDGYSGELRLDRAVAEFNLPVIREILEPRDLDGWHYAACPVLPPLREA